MRFCSGLKLPKNSYHTEEFVFSMSHFLRHGTTCFINPRLQRRGFFLTRDPVRRGRQSPLESFFDSSQLSVSRRCKSIAQHNTPALKRFQNSGPCGVRHFLNPLLSVHFKPVSFNYHFGLLYG